MGAHNLISELYKETCLTIDYPPLMAFFEKAWGHILYHIAPEELSLKLTFNISLKFQALLRLTVIVTDLFYFFTLLALFKFAAKL